MLAAALAAAWLAAPAPAQQLPEDNSGTGQYIEPVPDAEGDRPANPGGGGDRSGGGSGGGGEGSGGGELPPSVRDSLPPGEEGQILERLVTDPGSGAPSDGGGDGDRSREAGSGPGGRSGAAAGDEPSALGAVAGAATGDDGPAIPLLALGVLVLTLGAAALRVRASRS